MRLAMLRADPALSRFDPLPRILSFDDFSRGHCGWSQLVGNYEDSLDSMLPGYAQHSSAMLSTLGHWDAGSHGGMDSSYALKIATRARPGAQNVAIKRHTFRRRGPIRFELFFTFKPEATELKLSETDVRSIGLLFDLQCGDRDGDGERVMPHLRFLNALDGKHLQKWQYKRETTRLMPIGSEDKTVSHYHLAPGGWLDLPDGEQRLCYNEIPTKVNWSYLRFDFDLVSMKALGLQCNDRSFDLSNFDSIRIPAMKNLWCMLNFCLFAETDVAKRAFLYVDSICISGDF
ncbi:DUF6772 family protein [Neorhizobium sp. Rsf11]|uniref:DUF6772 family protein n=2 Tax=Neorhizobium TaxID=1525371 RepID=A0ABV0M1C4_9HYPH|nr:DUF6772 family protein [Neorhizobium petrolearium]MCC2612300.1 hypothetical protein [Neorhizobium petrolearium]WGI71293.1 hypothetical protein QEO92_20980 [Neorhizobium petrolearium]